MNTEQVDAPVKEVDNRPWWKRFLGWETKSRTADQLFLLGGGVVMFLALIPWFMAGAESGNWWPAVSHSVSIVGFGVSIADKRLMGGRLHYLGLLIIALGIAVAALTAY